MAAALVKLQVAIILEEQGANVTPEKFPSISFFWMKSFHVSQKVFHTGTKQATAETGSCKGLTACKSSSDTERQTASWSSISFSEVMGSSQ